MNNEARRVFLEAEVERLRADLARERRNADQYRAGMDSAEKAAKVAITALDESMQTVVDVRADLATFASLTQGMPTFVTEGCWDHGCHLSPPEEQGPNSGCRCHHDQRVARYAVRVLGRLLARLDP